MGKDAAAVTAPSSSFTTSNAPGGVLNIPGEGMSDAIGLLGGAGDLAAPASGLSAAMPLIGVGLTAASTVMSFIEAGKAKDAQRAAQKETDRLVEEGRRLMAQNEVEAVQVPVESFDRQFREGTAANAQAIEALSQDPRFLLGGVQGVQEATIEGQAKTREGLADRIYSDAMTKAGTKMSINKDLSKLNLEEAYGAQIAAMAAEKAKIAQQQATMQGGGGILTQGTGMIGTYGGLATPGDKLQGLLKGIDPKMIESFMQFMSQQQKT